MVKIKDGEGPQKVPLIYYDDEGERHVVGDAAVEIKNGEVIALGKIDWGQGDVFASGMSLEGFSISSSEPSPVFEAARRLGPTSLQHRQYVTDSNPNGEVRQCSRRDPHEPHEYEAKMGDFFFVYCPGYQGSER